MVVDSINLSQFFSQITAWPNTHSDYERLINEVDKFFGEIFVGVFCYKPGGKSAIKFHEKYSMETSKREGLIDYLKNQLRQYYGSVQQTHRIMLSQSELRLPIPSSVQYLTYSPILELGTRSSNERNFGAIVIGSDVPLVPSKEVILVAIAGHLAHLAYQVELEKVIQIRSQFLSIASHELKTPLTSIYGILQLQERMLRPKKDIPVIPEQERHHGFLKMVIRQVERLNELINGLLDVSRIQNGRFMVEPSDTDVVAILKECVQNRLNMIAQEAGVKLNVDVDQELIAWVDPVRMEEVICNLVMNAIRYSPEGGVVWIRLRGDGDSFRLTIRDQGPSISIEDRERIFQPFEKAQRTGRIGGLGLGLFISREIAQLHGGNVSLLESVPGKGNVFEAYFPIRNPQQMATA
jgi:signal transduction histidine kinase